MRSLLYTVNTTSTAVAANGTIPLGTTVRRFGQAIRTSGNVITLLEAGYYDVSVSINAEPVAATSITATLYEGTTAVSGASVTATPSAASADTPLVIPAGVVRVYCNSVKTLSVQLSAAALVNSSSITVTKV